MIILDPSYRNECTVWFGDGNVQTLRGSVSEICRCIYNYVMDDYIHFKHEGLFETSTRQIHKVYIDTKGIGHKYCDWFEHMGVEVNECTYERRIHNE